MSDNLINIVFCLFALSECLYLWHIRNKIDDLLEELRGILRRADDKCSR